MGGCLTTAKVTGSNSNTNTNNNPATTVVNRKQTTRPQPAQNNHHRANEAQKKHKHKPKQSSRQKTGVIPCGKRTDFGYDKNFDRRYTIGKLLGHGQFGYTYVATDRSNGDRVAVKRINKNKVIVGSDFIENG